MLVNTGDKVTTAGTVVELLAAKHRGSWRGEIDVDQHAAA
jgi:hypothetical protein